MIQTLNQYLADYSENITSITQFRKDLAEIKHRSQTEHDSDASYTSQPPRGFITLDSILKIVIKKKATHKNLLTTTLTNFSKFTAIGKLTTPVMTTLSIIIHPLKPTSKWIRLLL